MKLDKYLEKENNTKIRKIMNDKREQEWLIENKEAIKKQNERIEREGSFSDEHRRF